ncbi:MAG: Ribonuclease [Candidatus Parcubacteria bacterium]|jgi:ribonuclease P protein component
MLPRRARVGTSLFDQVMKSGRVIHSIHFSFRYSYPTATPLSKKDSPTRISAVATKKIFKTSVARHAVTRKIYKAVRVIGETLTFPPITLVIFAKAGAESLSFEDTLAEIKKCFVEKF